MIRPTHPTEEDLMSEVVKFGVDASSNERFIEISTGLTKFQVKLNTTRLIEIIQNITDECQSDLRYYGGKTKYLIGLFNTSSINEKDSLRQLSHQDLMWMSESRKMKDNITISFAETEWGKKWIEEIQALAVHTGMLYTPACCTRRHTVHAGMLYTPTCCTRRHAVHAGMLYTPTCCTRRHAIQL